MFKDRMEGTNLTKGTIIVGGKAGNAYSFVASSKQRKEIGLLHRTVQEKGSQDSGGRRILSGSEICYIYITIYKFISD